MNIDTNKIIAAFTDCKGTCKTPIGCTCGNSEEETEEEVVVEQSIVSIATSTETVAVETTETVTTASKSVLHKQVAQKAKLCGCGKSATGFCGCSAKSGGNGSCCSGTNKLEVHNWMLDMPEMMTESKMVEVQFKSTRKDFFINSNDLELCKGDVVAVESSPGHDIGEVTLTGKLVDLQMKKTNFRGEIKRVYRIAKQSDLEKYEQAKAKEHKTMLRAREIAEELQLNMKISDVEYQGDGNKAIFYYIADGRVDFRQLIKCYASEFRLKIEMKQIGARQEAGRVGGIGPCGRELCCSSSMSNFISVSTSAARLQDIPLNPQKLAGQCGKLKCCLNFEVDTYVEAQKKLPPREVILETKDGSFFHFKTDILSGMMTYSTDKYFAANLVTLPHERVFEIIGLNKKGDRPLTLIDHQLTVVENTKSLDVLEQESITRFDTGNNERSQARKNRKRKANDRQGGGNRGGQEENRENKASENRGANRNENRRNERRNDGPKKVVKVGEQAQASAASPAEQGNEQAAPKKQNRRNKRPPQNRNRPNDNKNSSNRNPRNEKRDDNKKE